MSPSWHLAIESSGLGGSVALFSYRDPHQGELHSQAVLPGDKGSVRTLAPGIDQLLRQAQIQASQLSSLSVTCGPGSFTGLRVGLTTAKMLAWSAKIPAVPIDTLEAIACRFVQANAHMLPDRYRLVTGINAFRRQVFTSSWTVDGSALECRSPSKVIDVDQWLSDPWQADTLADDRPIWICGGAIGAYPGLDTARFQLADSALWSPLAEQVGKLGLAGLAEGRAVTADQLAPNYIRSSAAEEKVRSR